MRGQEPQEEAEKNKRRSEVSVDEKGGRESYRLRGPRREEPGQERERHILWGGGDDNDGLEAAARP